MIKQFRLIQAALKILIEMAIEHFKPSDDANWEKFEKYSQQVNKLNEIKKNWEE